MKWKVRDLNLQDNQENKGMRLQVVLAHSGVASRRASEQIISDGRVTVNGKVVTQMGEKVFPSDEICVDGKKISIEEKKQYVLLNKPKGYVCSLADEKGRNVAADLLKEHYSERLYNVGRLDMYSEGLIIFTNDGDFAAKVSHPSSQIEKEYIVETSLPFPDKVIESFKKGIRIEGVFYKCKNAQRINSRKMSVVLVEGKNREIRTVISYFDLNVRKLQRVRIGSILIKDLKVGQFRNLDKKEIDSLLSITDEKEM